MFISYFIAFGIQVAAMLTVHAIITVGTIIIRNSVSNKK